MYEQKEHREWATKLDKIGKEQGQASCTKPMQPFCIPLSVCIMSICLSPSLSFCLCEPLSVYLSFGLFVCLSLCLWVCLLLSLSMNVIFCQSICLSVCLSALLSVCLSVYESHCLFVYLFVCLFVSMSPYLSLFSQSDILFVCQYVCLFVCLFVFVSIRTPCDFCCSDGCVNCRRRLSHHQPLCSCSWFAHSKEVTAPLMISGRELKQM